MTDNADVSEANPLVRASRAGDRFHYCLAARRSLSLLDNNSGLDRIIIEGDDVSGTNGEYSLDMTEVYRDGFAFDRIKYQFKYSVERVGKPFAFSELKKTIVGFAENYQAQLPHKLSLRYLIVTNRGVSDELKKCVVEIASGKRATGRTATSFYRSIVLPGDTLKTFCGTLVFQDMEEDLEIQFQNLRVQSASYTSGIPSVESMYALVDMVARKALPKSNGVITREDVLSNFCKGVTSMSAFYPAPSNFEDPEDWIETAGYKEVQSRVLNAKRNVFIHAAGGVGKTVTLRKLAADIPSGSAAILFDCFAAGEYANRLKYRHTPEKALVQISNELAAMGLCDPLVAESGTTSQIVFEAWHHRIECAVEVLRQKNAGARLYIFVDAADNARMMADETQEACFVDYVLESSGIDGCTIVFSARTGRMNAFWPDLNCEKIEVMPFSRQEVGEVLRRKFSDASSSLASRLFVRTSGLPRIVAGILADCKSIQDVEAAASLAPITDYDSYLESKYQATLKRYSKTERKKLDCLCRCLVTLPPNVPIKVLGTAANVSDDFILGFISDWERPLWHSQEHLHFRDEPTETWFRKRFGECENDLQQVIKAISPLSERFVYVARSLPSLLLRARDYNELEKLAESDKALPVDIHPAERKELRLERLRFAVSAMIRSRKYASAIRLSLLAGEMVSESWRRVEALNKNLVFASKALPEEMVGELAATRQLELDWPGSENLCAGVLLSSLADTREEVDVYLKSAQHWFLLYLEKNQNKSENTGWPQEDYAPHVLEARLFGRTLLITHGPQAAIEHIAREKSSVTRYHGASLLAHDCVSFNEKSLVEDMLRSSGDGYVLLGLLDEALDYGCELVIPGWRKIVHVVQKLAVTDHLHWDVSNNIRRTIARFAVWLARQKGGSSAVASILSTMVLPVASFRPCNSPIDFDINALPFYALTRICQKKSCSLKSIMKNIKAIAPSGTDYDLKQMEEHLAKLLPVYIKIVKAYVSADMTLISAAFRDVAGWLHGYQLSHQDKKRLFLDSVAWLSCVAPKDAESLLAFIEANNQLGFISATDSFALARKLSRRGHLATARACLSHGTECFDACKQDPDVGPEELSELYIQAAEACYAFDLDDARGYFEEVFDVLAKCGDELLPRWDAVTAIARRLSQPELREGVSQKLVYDFTRCGEYVRRCVIRDKYYNRSEVFAILANFDPAYAWATFSRWRDRRVGSFCSDLSWVLKEFTDKGLMSLEEAWSFRAFGNHGEIQEITEAIVQASGLVRFKRKVFDNLLLNYAKNGCSSRNVRTIRLLAKQLNIDVPMWLHPRPDSSSLALEAIERTGKDEVELPPFERNESNWVYEALSRLKEIWNANRKCKLLFSKVPEQHACFMLKQLANDSRIHLFDIKEIVAHLPDAWKKKPGVKSLMPSVLAQLTARVAREGDACSVEAILACADEFGIGQKTTEDYLAAMSKVSSLNGESYFQIVKIGSRLLTPEEMVAVFECALCHVSGGMDPTFGDGQWTQAIWPEKPFKEVTQDVLWTAMGDPDVKVRWMATHCVANELLRAPVEVLPGFVNRLSRTDFFPFVSSHLPPYVYFSRMHFLLALAKVSKQIAATIRNNASEIAGFLHGQNHVMIRYLGWKALADAGVSAPTLRRLNPLEGINEKHVSRYLVLEKADINSAIPDLNGKSEDFPLPYDFEKYWLQSFAGVFGFLRDDCRELLMWAASDLIRESPVPIAGQDPRRTTYCPNHSTLVSDFGIPEESNLVFYISYHSLMILAGKLINYFPVLHYAGEAENRFAEWMKELLPIFAPDLSNWQSDVRGCLPEFISCENDVCDMLEESPLQKIGLEKLLQISRYNNKVLINGHWQIRGPTKDFSCLLSCALVSKKRARWTRRQLLRLKDPMSLALPTLFHNPNDDFRNHGNYEWRGVFDREQENPRYHVDEQDPAAGGLYLVRFHVSKTICKDLRLQDGGDHISLFRQDGSPALVSWYWGEVSHESSESEGSYGCLLEADFAFLDDLCNRYCSELIIELVLNRHKRAYRGNYPYPDKRETCYRYALYSPKKGIY